MIVKTLPRLISSGETINLPNLYKSYLTGEMKRQKVLKKRTFLLTDEARLELLQELAAQISFSVTQSITFADAVKLVETHIGPPKHELESHTRDFLTNSFLIRNGDDYRLSHKSILEFLVAMRLNEEIRSDNPAMFRELVFKYQIFDFLKEFEPNQATLVKWIQSTADSEMRDSPLGANAAELLIKISPTSLAGKDLSGANLTAANLSGTDLRTTVLSDASLANSSLRRCKFYRATIRATKFSGTHISFHVLKPAKTRGHHFQLFMDFVSEKLHEAGKDIPIGFFAVDAFRPDLFWEVTTRLSNASELDRMRDLLSSILESPAAVFWDEFEQIEREADSAKT